MRDFAGIRFIFLDRDGVLNRKAPEGQYVRSVDELQVLPGAADAVAELNRSGHTVLVVTNQRGISLGLYSLEDLGRVHEALQAELQRAGGHVDRFYACPHNKGECRCRKPGTGMIEQAFGDYPEATAQNSVLIGDSLSDMQAGRAAGMRTILIEGDRATRKAGFEDAVHLADAVCESLRSAVALVRKNSASS